MIIDYGDSGDFIYTIGGINNNPRNITFTQLSSADWIDVEWNVDNSNAAGYNDYYDILPIKVENPIVGIHNDTLFVIASPAVDYWNNFTYIIEYDLNDLSSGEVSVTEWNNLVEENGLNMDGANVSWVECRQCFAALGESVLAFMGTTWSTFDRLFMFDMNTKLPVAMDSFSSTMNERDNSFSCML